MDKISLWPRAVQRGQLGLAKNGLKSLLESVGSHSDTYFVEVFGASGILGCDIYNELADLISDMELLLSDEKKVAKEGDDSDADRFASMVLYLLLRVGSLFSNPEQDGGDLSTECLLGLISNARDRLYVDMFNLGSIPISCDAGHVLLDQLSNMERLVGDILEKLQPDKEEAMSDQDVLGIVTVLEHEYQSVLRRMDAVFCATGMECYGFRIYKRPWPDVDMKTMLPPRTDKHTGWAMGWMGDRQVIVVCTGNPGAAASSLAARRVCMSAAVRRHVDVGRIRNWLIVGVCATNNRGWHLGQPIVSRDQLIPVEPTHASGKKWKIHAPKKPIQLKQVPPSERDVSIWFRPKPRSDELTFIEKLSIEYARFICSKVVIDVTAGRDALLSMIPDQSDANLGIEMEGVGTVGLHDEIIIKAVCDYADDDKGGSWTDKTKTLVQLFAAEAAAEAMLAVIPHLP